MNREMTNFKEAAIRNRVTDECKNCGKPIALYGIHWLHIHDGCMLCTLPRPIATPLKEHGNAK